MNLLEEILSTPLGSYLDENPAAVITACGVRMPGGYCGQRLKRCPQPESEYGPFAECQVHGLVPVFAGIAR